MRTYFLRALAFLCLAISIGDRVAAQCSSENSAFKSGETLVYDLHFNWKFVWFKVGTATFNITQSIYGKQAAYRTTLTTRTSGTADKYFTMRDRLTSYTTLDLVPLYYEKDAFEGNARRVEKVWYTYPDNQVALKMFYQRDKQPAEWHNHKGKYCAYDMLSMMLRARSLDGNKMKVGERINFVMAEGKHAEWRSLVYRGKKNFKLDNRTLTYRCLVFSYLEKEDGKEKEIVTFYVTDDQNHLPVRIDMNLNFGTAKAYLTGSTGVRNPQTSIIKK